MIPLAPVLTICQCAGCLYGEPEPGHCITGKGKLRHWCAATKRAGLLPKRIQDQAARKEG